MSKFKGTVESIVFRNEDNGWTVASVQLEGSGRTSAVGVMPMLAPGDHVLLEGEMVEHRDYGEQIKVSMCEIEIPQTQTGLEKYLGSGRIRGIGPSTAKMIVKRFGTDALDILESQPERLIELPGIGPKKLAMIVESFREQNGMRNTLIFLQGAGLSPSVAAKVYKCFGEMSESVLKSNPYRLANEVDGVGFQTADRIARTLGFMPENPHRLASGVLYALSSAVNSSGHMYLPFEELSSCARELLGVSDTLTEHSIRSMLNDNMLREDTIEGVRAIYLPRMLRVERETAELLRMRRGMRCRISVEMRDAQQEIEDYEQRAQVELSQRQREAVARAAEGGLTIITGGPGTGKTTSINCILHLVEERGKVELCAPTGRAAKRMSEATGRSARTIHRMLEYNGESGGFMRNEDNPIDADVVVVDEMSMVDIFLMRSLLRALKNGTKLILVGDADQLPSVGAGNVLRDIIESKTMPVVALDQIFRQGQQSFIVTNAHRINRGEYPKILTRDTDFFLERKQGAEEAADAVVALVRERLPKYLSVDRLRGIQVMAPMKKGAIGVYKLNERLQAALNPKHEGCKELLRGDCAFRLGDKVMQVRNNYDLTWERELEDGEGVFNGDIGYIVALDVEAREMTVEFDDGRRAVYDDSMLDELELSYCISVHKSQGSEFEAVVLPLISGPQMLMTRNLLYTAVTRARRLVVIVGREDCMCMMVDNKRIQRRYSALKQRLSEGLRA